MQKSNTMELPKTLGGKIKRKELREEDERMYANK